jgi:PIN domain
MFKVLIDTCVWLDLAKDHQQQAILAALEELIRQGDITLILPRTIVDESARNRARIVEESGRSLSGTLKRAKEAIEKFGDPRQKDTVLHELNDVDHRLPTLGEAAAVATVGRVEKLFAASEIIEISDSVKLRAAQRATDKRAPFHRQRNGIDDAILIEVYADVLSAKAGGVRFAFITHNTKDFSHQNASNTLPHLDLAGCFSRLRSGGHPWGCCSMATCQPTETRMYQIGRTWSLRATICWH